MTQREDVMRAALERIAGKGQGAKDAYYNPSKGLPTTFALVRKIAREALAEVDALPEDDTDYMTSESSDADGNAVWRGWGPS